MKKVIVWIGMLCLLCGCGNAADAASESVVESVAAETVTTEAAGKDTKAEGMQAETVATQEAESEGTAAAQDAEAESTAAAKDGKSESTAAAKDGKSESTTAAKDGTTESTAAAKDAEAEGVLAEGETMIEEGAAKDAEALAAKDAEALEKQKEVTENITVFEEKKTMYATIALNVRRGPSTEYEVVSHLVMGQAVEITGQAETGWYQMLMDGVPAYASHKYLSENKVEVQAAPAPAPQQAAPQQAAPAAAPQPTTPTAAVAPAGVIMVGDSRCVQMQAAVGGGGCSWVCENSKEYTWFSETAIPKFDQYVGNGTKVVINMGVNDPEHYQQYAELINVKAAEWAQRGARTYLVSVNPVWENPYTTQEQVDTFNANVPGMLVGVTWIDTSTWLNTNGYRVLDGLHYDDPTYVNIFNLIMGSL